MEEVVLCVPPDRATGRGRPVTLAAAAVAGVDEVYAVGGAQAIAAMAYGTESIAPVDVIAGPGNIYVALAKQEVAGDVGIAAAFAGPSEVVVVADDTAPADCAAIDVMVQAEHGPDGLAWLVTWDEAVADAVCAAGRAARRRTPGRRDPVDAGRGRLAALVDGPAAALAVATHRPRAPRAAVRGRRSAGPTVSNAGAIFCGPWSPASVGDYVAGPSHVLPTYGSARFASALTVDDFAKDHHVVTVDRAAYDRVGRLVDA